MLSLSFKITRFLILEKKIFQGVYNIRALPPFLSCDLDYLYKPSFNFPMSPVLILALFGQVVAEKKMFV